MSKIAGMLFFLSGGIIFMGIITAEIFYPGSYSISGSMISTLAASPPPDSVVKEPSAGIFDSVMMISGLMIIAGACLTRRTHDNKLVTALALMGLGALGVGVFPAFHPLAHPISALLVFLAGGVSAVLSAKVTTPPFSFISMILGTITLLALFLGLFLAHLVVPVLGPGGVERWVGYPSIIWLIGFGGYLMSSRK